MADITNLTTNFNTLFGFIATLAAIVLGFLSAKNKVTIVALEDSNNAYKNLHETDKLQLDSQDKQIKLLTQKSEILEKHVTQAPSITELAVQLGEQHKETMKAMANMADSNNKIANQMSKIAKALIKDSQSE